MQGFAARLHDRVTAFSPGSVPASHTARVKVRDVLDLLHRDGWRLVRHRGSHRQFQHECKTGTVTVAGHPGVELPPSTLRSILRQAGLGQVKR
jgi:predicted RNA binding protein YcfA (HicA-like mRNA interferase family)